MLGTVEPHGLVTVKVGTFEGAGAIGRGSTGAEVAYAGPVPASFPAEGTADGRSFTASRRLPTPNPAMVLLLVTFGPA